MQNKKATITLSIILALIYLISGIAKAADIESFADIIVQYGFPKLYVLAPIITFIEIVLAFAFLLFWNTRKVALFSLGFIILLSSTSLVGLLFMGIEDCGCLGRFYKLPIWLSMLRNIFMILSSCWLYKNGFQFKNNRFEFIKPIIAFGLGLTTLIITAFDMKESYYEVSYTQGTDIKNTFLEEYEQSDDTKKLIFIFSPRCGHCKKITPLVNNLLKQKNYDEVIGLYPKEIPEKFLKQYISELKPIFKIKAIPYDSIRKITRGFPLFITLKNGKIEKIMREI
jgi:thiol-disulfide isomerase/thioredoxin